MWYVYVCIHIYMYVYIVNFSVLLIFLVKVYSMCEIWESMNLKKNFFRLDLFLFSCVKALTYMKLRMMALRRQGQVDLWIQSQPGVQSKFQDNWGYISQKTKKKTCGSYNWSLGLLDEDSLVGFHKFVTEFLKRRLSDDSLFPEARGQVAVGVRVASTQLPRVAGQPLTDGNSNQYWLATSNSFLGTGAGTIQVSVETGKRCTNTEAQSPVTLHRTVALVSLVSPVASPHWESGKLGRDDGGLLDGSGYLLRAPNTKTNVTIVVPKSLYLDRCSALVCSLHWHGL